MRKRLVLRTRAQLPVLRQGPNSKLHAMWRIFNAQKACNLIAKMLFVRTVSAVMVCASVPKNTCFAETTFAMSVTLLCAPIKLNCAKRLNGPALHIVRCIATIWLSASENWKKNKNGMGTDSLFEHVRAGAISKKAETCGSRKS